MLRKVLPLVLVLGMLCFTGCLTKPISYMEAAATEALHPDGPVSSFLGYGPWSDEFAASIDHFEAHRRTYENDLHAIVDDWDKHFLRYDPYDPFAE